MDARLNNVAMGELDPIAPTPNFWFGDVAFSTVFVGSSIFLKVKR
jgi:hypothetical protein